MCLKQVRRILLSFIVLTLTTALQAADSSNWNQVLEKAKGQTVFFNAWGGSSQINDYIRWVEKEVNKRYDITLRHIKVSDTASVVSRVLAEKNAGRDEKGTVDLVWINGENFKSMKQNGLLYGPFAEQLPSFRGVDPNEKKTTVVDFGEPVEGYESPWGMAQLVFIYDTDQTNTPPKNAHELISFAEKNKGRVTYPLPPDFVGTTFLKQLLLELTNEPETLQSAMTASNFERVTAPLWVYLDKLHPLLWREGKVFPANNLALTPLLDDGEIILSMTFNPSYASSAIANGEMAETVRTYVHDTGTVGNTHFLAIPYNSSVKEAAKVVSDFMLSAEAQARKANPEIWGDPTVLSMSRLSKNDKSLFATLPLGIATLSPEQLGKTLPEPHHSWTAALEQAWQKRYR
ncbi:hypothetical protein ACH42_10510 [Endozoicomonas sp. (ex Bugula neritina AB1)]|nr:hypothetical protein ACH42_10510 [Endozoicomonas sp. (ex Bugula neritina AB1)]